MSLPQIKDHKEVVKKVLYEKDFNVESNGKIYPKNRIKAQYVTYSGLRLDKDGNYQEYTGDKVVISVSKLVIVDGNIEVAKKILKNKNGDPYTVNDTKDIILSTEEFIDVMTNIDPDLEN